MTERYGIYKGSQSAHCCFEWTVVDLTKPQIFGGEHYEDEGGKHYDPVCECFVESDARLIVEALNHYEGTK